MGHSVSDAAAASVKKSEKKIKSERTEEQIIRDIGNHLEARLSVPPDDVRLLYRLYTELKTEVDQVKATGVYRTELEEDDHRDREQSERGAGII